jgi:hypothetical protein
VPAVAAVQYATGMATRPQPHDPAALLPTPAERQALRADAQARLAARRAGQADHGLVDPAQHFADDNALVAELLGEEPSEPPPFQVLALPSVDLG